MRTDDALIQPGELSPTEHSSSLARIIEYQFLADLLQEAWFGRRMLVDVMYSSVDAFGYDLVIESGDVIRHVQLKTRARAGRTASYGSSSSSGTGRRDASCGSDTAGSKEATAWRWSIASSVANPMSSFPIWERRR